MRDYRMSPQGADVLADREDLRTKAYRDSEGYWTIGVGHLLSLDKNADFSSLVWTREKCLEVFAQDLAKYEAAVNRGLNVDAKPYQFDALVSFGHNIGEAGVENSWVIKELNKGDLVAAAAAFDNWHKPTSIISRRNAEKAQFMSLVPVVARMRTDPGSVGGEKVAPMLRRGSRGDAVADLQRKLLVFADGDFGPATENAVRMFQKEHGLYPDGVAGPATMVALNGGTA